MDEDERSLPPLDRMASLELVSLIHREDRTVAAAIEPQLPRIAAAVDAIADRLANGGRLFYAGAGTSGRIAALDASELPPTFGVPADLVQVLMAGGERAFLHAVEGAEDDDHAAIDAVAANVSADDCLLGIAASGTTPYTVAAVRKANLIGALTAGITANPLSPLARECDFSIVVETGPEVVEGSSRLKAGTAQKLVLNMISTAVMIRLGHVFGNLMVDMPATNAKLRERAVAMVQKASGAGRSEALEALGEAGGVVKTAIVMMARRVDAAEARRLLEAGGGNLREVLGR